MAGGLAVRLVKRDAYAFNAEAPAPGPADISRALGVVGG
jgi:cobalamin biosynthesis protein CobD/CbiB